MFIKYLTYLGKICKEDEWIVCFLDGVQSHLTENVLKFCVQNNTKLVPRPPNTSDKIQNEDLWTFWILRNDKTFGYNKLKQERFQWVLHNTKRKALNFAVQWLWSRPHGPTPHQPRTTRLRGVRAAFDRSLACSNCSFSETK